MTDIREEVRKRYASAALSVSDSCCSGDSCDDQAGFGSRLYTKDELSEIPTEAGLASLGCGNPTMVAELAPGETVLDLGSGSASSQSGPRQELPAPPALP